QIDRRILVNRHQQGMTIALERLRDCRLDLLGHLPHRSVACLVALVPGAFRSASGLSGPDAHYPIISELNNGAHALVAAGPSHRSTAWTILFMMPLVNE